MNSPMKRLIFTKVHGAMIKKTKYILTISPLFQLTHYV